MRLQGRCPCSFPSFTAGLIQPGSGSRQEADPVFSCSLRAVPRPCPSLPPWIRGEGSKSWAWESPTASQSFPFPKLLHDSAGSSPSWPLPVITKVIINIFLTDFLFPTAPSLQSAIPWLSGKVPLAGNGPAWPGLRDEAVLGVPLLVFGSAWGCPRSCSSPSGWRTHRESLDCSKKSLVTPPLPALPPIAN